MAEIAARHTFIVVILLIPPAKCHELEQILSAPRQAGQAVDEDSVDLSNIGPGQEFLDPAPAAIVAAGTRVADDQSQGQVVELCIRSEGDLLGIQAYSLPRLFIGGHPQ